MGDPQGIMGNSLRWAKPPAAIPFSAKVRRKSCAGRERGGGGQLREVTIRESMVEQGKACYRVLGQCLLC